jgi:uncharacterized protein related to proFAR isomerase
MKVIGMTASDVGEGSGSAVAVGGAVVPVESAAGMVGVGASAVLVGAQAVTNNTVTISMKNILRIEGSFRN